MLQNTLEDYKIPLNYTFDSQINTNKSKKRVFLRVIDELSISDTTKVKDDGFLLVPLIIAGGYKGNFTVTLGENNVQPTFKDFILDSFQTEVNRSGDFMAVKNAFRSDYIIEMTLIDCEISTQYHKDRIRFAEVYKENWILKPVNGNFTVEIKLLENKKTILNKKYTSNLSSQLETQRFESGASMNLKMMKDFASTASIEIKEILETVISDINEQI